MNPLAECLSWIGNLKIFKSITGINRSAIDNLIPVLYHFVIIQSQEPIQDFKFIQSLISREDTSKLILIFILKSIKKSTSEIRRNAAGGVSHTVTGHRVRVAAEISRTILIS